MIFGTDISKFRNDFSILKDDIIYFDSACMTFKPRQVVGKINEYYNEYAACAGRSSHHLAKQVGFEMDKARLEVKKFINAKYNEEIIFTRNATEGLNIVANCLNFEKGDEIIISDKEHNSNLIPWLKLSKKVGIVVKVVDSKPDNTFDLDKFKSLLSARTKLVSIVHISNLDGVENPIKNISKIVHEHGSLFMVDGAQSVPHIKVDVRKLGVDFLCFSGHKMCGPTGTGVLYGRRGLLEAMDPFIVGGGTVVDSNYTNYEFCGLPIKFEAGLQDYAGIIGLGEACKYLRKIGLKKIHEHEIKLNKIITSGLKDYVEIIGPIDYKLRGGIFCFYIKGIDSHNVARILNASKKICVRSGVYCVHSWFNKHNLKGSVRASLYFYNTEEEARVFVDEVKKVCKLG